MTRKSSEELIPVDFKIEISIWAPPIAVVDQSNKVFSLDDLPRVLLSNNGSDLLRFRPSSYVHLEFIGEATETRWIDHQHINRALA